MIDDRERVSEEHKKEILDRIFGENTPEAVLEQIEETIYDYVSEDEIEEYDGDVHEAYSAYGRGEAESQVLNDLVRDALRDFGYNPHNADVDDFCEIYEELQKEWDIWHD